MNRDPPDDYMGNDPPDDFTGNYRISIFTCNSQSYGLTGSNMSDDFMSLDLNEHV